MSGPANPDLAACGDALYAAVAERLAGYVEARVLVLADGRVAGPPEDLRSAAAEAGARAAAEVLPRLRALLDADVDDQRTTPLEIVRGVVPPATATLERLGVPPAGRDRFLATRFPEDTYGLVPASLGALGEEVGELAIAWGAAKAMAHRRRHGPSLGP